MEDRILSIDIGMKNFAFCIGRFNATEHKYMVEVWENINFFDELQVQTLAKRHELQMYSGKKVKLHREVRKTTVHDIAKLGQLICFYLQQLIIKLGISTVLIEIQAKINMKAVILSQIIQSNLWFQNTEEVIVSMVTAQRKSKICSHLLPADLEYGKGKKNYANRKKWSQHVLVHFYENNWIMFSDEYNKPELPKKMKMDDFADCFVQMILGTPCLHCGKIKL